MTIEDLQEIYVDLQRIKRTKNRINQNNDLSPNQKKKECAWYTPKEKQLKSILKKYYSIFSVNADLLARHICNVLKHNISGSEISYMHACSGHESEKEYFEGVEKYYEGYASIKIYITRLEPRGTETLSILNRPVHKNLNYYTDFVLGNYSINIYNFLNNDNIKYSELFHDACWLAIKDNLKETYKELQTKTDSKQKLINKKIEELQNKAKLLERKNKKINNDHVLKDTEIKEIEKEI